MPLIVIEGTDGSGKSTLIDELSHAAPDNVKIFHCGPIKKHPMVEYEWLLTNYEPGSGQTVICDRLHVGELIYGPLYRGHSELTEAMKRHVELFLQAKGALRLVMGTPFEVIRSRLATRGEEFLQPQHLHLVHDFYDSYAYTEGWQLSQHEYDRRRYPRSLMRQAEKLEKQASVLKYFRTYVGPSNPVALLLGEKGNRFAGRPPYTSAFVPYTDSSGHVLLGALEQARPLKAYGLANALEEDVNALYEALGRPKLIALGNEAAKKVNLLGLPLAGHVQHPAYVRRFAYAQLGEYGQKIGDIIND